MVAEIIVKFENFQNKAKKRKHTSCKFTFILNFAHNKQDLTIEVYLWVRFSVSVDIRSRH